jgi:hypothetical protein
MKETSESSPTKIISKGLPTPLEVVASFSSEISYFKLVA